MTKKPSNSNDNPPTTKDDNDSKGAITLNYAATLLTFLGLVIAAAAIIIPTWLATRSTQSPQSQTLLNTPLVTLSPTRPTSKELEIQSREGWQSTYFEVRKGETIYIEVIKGRWTYAQGGATPPYDTGEGSNYICSTVEPEEACEEPLPSVPAGALIGRIDIGGDFFAIGNSKMVDIQENGILQLRINDDDPGLEDNDGSLIVRIALQP